MRNDPGGESRVGLGGWVNHLGEERKEDRVGAVGEVEAVVAEYPVKLPVVVGVAVLIDVAACIREPQVARWQVFEVVQAAKKLHLVHTAVPLGYLHADVVEDVAPRDLRDPAGGVVALVVVGVKQSDRCSLLR